MRIDVELFFVWCYIFIGYVFFLCFGVIVKVFEFIGNFSSLILICFYVRVLFDFI